MLRPQSAVQTTVSWYGVFDTISGNLNPYSGLTIKNGYFSVEHYAGSAWRWTRIPTFKYSKAENDWFYIKTVV